MKRPLVRLPSLLLALFLGLTACGVGGKPGEVHKINWTASPAYLAEDVELPVPTGDLIGCCTDGEYMYILADEKTEAGIRSLLSRVSLADGTTETLEEYQPPELPENARLNRYGPILSPDGMLWVYETWTVSYYDLPEDFDPDQEFVAAYLTRRDEFHHLRQLDSRNGRQKKLVDLSEAVIALGEKDPFIFSSFAVDAQENIYFSQTGGLAVLNSFGNLQFTLEADLPRTSVYNAAGGNLALLPDGSIAALTVKPGGGREVRVIDPAAKTWKTERYELSGMTDMIYNGTGGFLFFYTSAGILHGWEPEEEAGRPLLRWFEAGLKGGVMAFAPLNGGHLAALTQQYTQAAGSDDYWYSASLRLSLLTPSDRSPADGKTTLIYGTIGLTSPQRTRIDQFNEENDQYYIEVRNYAGENVDVVNDLKGGERESAVDAAKKLLAAEVAAGNIPDIWDKSLPLELYARKGYFEDLWPFIDGDKELGGRDALMTHVLDCASVDGKLYQAANSFTIQTAIARSEVAGHRTGWTMEEMLDTWKTLPEDSRLLSDSMGGIYLLELLCTMDLDRWMDWSAGECFFDSREFKDILKLCGSVNQDSGYDYNTYFDDRDLRSGGHLMSTAWLSRPEDILVYEAICGGPEILTDYAAYLSDNGLTPHGVTEDGKKAIYSSALNQIEKIQESGRLYSCWPLSPDAVIGAVEGGGYVSYVGYPTQSGAGSAFQLPNAYSWDAAAAMSASCRDKEGAWSYIRRMLLPEGAEATEASDGITYLINGFPINKAVFQSMFEPIWYTWEDADGNMQYALDANGERIEMPNPHSTLLPVPSTIGDKPVNMVIFCLAPNEAQMAQFMSLYNSIDRMYADIPELLDIILDQAAPYFAGDKSLDETADLIQRRATLYVNENR